MHLYAMAEISLGSGLSPSYLHFSCNCSSSSSDPTASTSTAILPSPLVFDCLCSIFSIFSPNSHPLQAHKHAAIPAAPELTARLRTRGDGLHFRRAVTVLPYGTTPIRARRLHRTMEELEEHIREGLKAEPTGHEEEAELSASSRDASRYSLCGWRDRSGSRRRGPP